MSRALNGSYEHESAPIDLQDTPALLSYITGLRQYPQAVINLHTAKQTGCGIAFWKGRLNTLQAPELSIAVFSFLHQVFDSFDIDIAALASESGLVLAS